MTATLGAERFLHEIEIVAGLQHPHILPLYESGEADGLLYYVMPFAEGESLRQRLDREKQLAVDESVRIAVEVADGRALLLLGTHPPSPRSLGMSTSRRRKTSTVAKLHEREIR